MHKAKNIYFLLILKKTRWPKAGGGPRQGTFSYSFHCIPLRVFTFVPFYNVFPLISVYNFHICKISLLSFSISIYHIFHIFHRLDRFPGSSFPMSSLPASPLYFFQSVSSCLPCPSVIKFSEFGTSYFTRIFFARCNFSSFPIFLTISLHFTNLVPLISLMSYTPTVKFQIFCLFVFS